MGGPSRCPVPAAQCAARGAGSDQKPTGWRTMKPSDRPGVVRPARARPRPARRCRSAAVDRHPGVAGVGVDRDVLAGPRRAVALQRARVLGHAEQAGRVQHVGDRARAVIARARPTSRARRPRCRGASRSGRRPRPSPRARSTRSPTARRSWWSRRSTSPASRSWIVASVVAVASVVVVSVVAAGVVAAAVVAAAASAGLVAPPLAAACSVGPSPRPSAARVAGPTTPSAVSPCAVWKA